nr:immunoglobulin light chain junction region [Macaca mulatta]
DYYCSSYTTRGTVVF